jgi:hypothetical protein
MACGFNGKVLSLAKTFDFFNFKNFFKLNFLKFTARKKKKDVYFLTMFFSLSFLEGYTEEGRKFGNVSQGRKFRLVLLR